MFITFEGIEGAGKSTQIRLLQERLTALGRRILVTREPGGSRLGAELRRILLSLESRDLTPPAEVFLLLADRAQHAETIIRPALDEGRIVLCDRYADSTTAYQGHGRRLDLETLRLLNEMAVAGLWPDLTILLDIEPEAGLTRAVARNHAEGKAVAEGRFEAESLDFHRRVREGFLAEARQAPGRFVVVDAARPTEAVFADVAAAVDRALAERG